MDLTNGAMSLEGLKSSISDFSFIKVRAKTVFNDVNKITELFSEFNKIGEALAHMNAYARICQLNEELDFLKTKTTERTDRNKKFKLDAEHKKLTNLSKLAKEIDLYQDQKFLDNLILLVKYGFSDQFEVTQFSNETLFTSCLKREYLREQEEILVKKYSRKTEKDVVVFGMISQAFSPFEAEPNEDDDVEYLNMKTALLNLVEHLTNIENSISGKQENEIVIDPIAVYFEV